MPRLVEPSGPARREVHVGEAQGDSGGASLSSVAGVDEPEVSEAVTVVRPVHPYVHVVIVGFAAFPRQPGRRFEWAWVLLLSPLWVILFGVFGVAPIVTRTNDLLPLLRNGLGFLGGAAAAYLIAQQTLGRHLQEQGGGES